MNSQLYGNKVELPEEVKTYLGQCFDSIQNADSSVEGYNRNQELRDTGYVTYQQLKRMKNWFDNFQGDSNDLSYILNGGDYVKDWVNKTLDSMRKGTELNNKTHDEYFPDDLSISTNDLKDFNVLGDKHKTSKEVYGLNVEHQIKRINQLIKTI